MELGCIPPDCTEEQMMHFYNFGKVRIIIYTVQSVANCLVVISIKILLKFIENVLDIEYFGGVIIVLAY